MIINFITKDKMLSVYEHSVPSTGDNFVFCGNAMYVEAVEFKLEEIKDEGYVDIVRYIANVYLEHVEGTGEQNV